MIIGTDVTVTLVSFLVGYLIADLVFFAQHEVLQCALRSIRLHYSRDHQGRKWGVDMG